jgi:hypothetical protein
MPSVSKQFLTDLEDGLRLARERLIDVVHDRNAWERRVTALTDHFDKIVRALDDRPLIETGRDGYNPNGFAALAGSIESQGQGVHLKDRVRDRIERDRLAGQVVDLEKRIAAARALAQVTPR